MDRCANCPHAEGKHGMLPDRDVETCTVRGCTCTGWEQARRLGLPVPDEMQPDWAGRYCPHPTMVLGETCPRCGRVVGSAEDIAIGKGQA